MPSTVVTPTTSGIRAARPRKKISDSTTRSGKASSSARPRSSVTVLPSWRPTTAEPPTATSSRPSNVSSMRLGDRLVVGVGGQGAEHQDLGAVPGDQRSRDRRAWSSGTSPGRPRTRPRARRSPPAPGRCRQARPCGVSTTITMPVPGAWPVAASMRSTARTESALSLAKPPEASREPARGPPKNPATSTNRNTASRLRRGWALMRPGDATGPAGCGRAVVVGAVGSGEGGSGSTCLDSPSREHHASSCRGRHFAGRPPATYSPGGTPRAVRCGRGLTPPAAADGPALPTPGRRS